MWLSKELVAASSGEIIVNMDDDDVYDKARVIQGRLVGQNGLAEWIQREIWPEIATLYA